MKTLANIFNIGGTLMKKIMVLSLFFVLVICSSVQAGLQDAFVVWDGKVYEVKKEVTVEKSLIGKSIGKVKTKPYWDNKSRTSLETYYGNASNAFPIGTRYFEIKGISPSTAIAVKVDNQWLKADYIYNAPYHIMNTLTNLFIIVPIVILPLILIGFIYRAKKLKNFIRRKFKTPLL